MIDADRQRILSQRRARRDYRRLAVWMVLLLVVLMTGCGPRYKPPVMVGFNTWVGYDPLYLAQELGYLDGSGLRLVELGSTTQTMDALRTGRLQMGTVTLDEALTLVQEGVPISVVWVLNVSAGADALVVRPDITQLADLQGKRIGVEQTAVGAFMLNAVLERAGLRASDINIVPLAVDEHLVAWRKGRVDALVTFDPVRQVLLREGAQTLFDSREMQYKIVDVLVVRKETLDCCARQVSLLIDGQQRALRYLNDQREDALHRIAPRQGLSPAEVDAAFAGVHLPDAGENAGFLLGAPSELDSIVSSLSQIMYEQGLLPVPVHADGLVDRRFVQGEPP